MRTLAEGPEPWAIPWPCVHEFLAIVTHPRIYDPPSPVPAALDQVAAWLESPSLVLLSEGPGYAAHLADGQRFPDDLVQGNQVGGLRQVIRDARVEDLWSPAPG